MAGQDLGDFASASHVGDEVACLQPLLLHAELEWRREGPGPVDGKRLVFVDLDQGSERSSELISLGCAPDARSLTDRCEPTQLCAPARS